uniref:Uncharacterized protein n=2 Tax=Chrysotila carterae TaxID=13221 RepID=A0A7S4BQ56_CHRCT
MLSGVRSQSEVFWTERRLVAPDWWQQLPIVPFRELCDDEMSEVARKYLTRQCVEASRRVHAHMARRRSWAINGAQVHRWIGTVQFGPRSLRVLDAYATETAARNALVGGQQGAWIISDFHLNSMRPAMQQLTAPDAHGDSLVTAGGHHRETSTFNTSTLTYTAELCLEITQQEGVVPSAKFTRMQQVCP